MQNVRDRPAAEDVRKVAVVEISQCHLQAGRGVHVEVPRQRRVAMDQPARRERPHLRESLEIPIRRALREKGRPEVGHERVAHEEESLPGKMDEQRIVRLAAADGDELKLQFAEPQRFLRRHRPIDADVEADRPLAKEPAEGPL